MTPGYTIEIDDRLALGATPAAVKTLSFSPPKQTIACVLNENRSVLFFEPGQTTPSRRMRVSDDPIEISGGGRDLAYVACRAARTVDVLSASGLRKRILLPGEPHSLAWNGEYSPLKQKIMVTCQLPKCEDGVVGVIDEETLTLTNVLKVGKKPRGISLDPQRKQILVANYGSDSITIIDQSGTRKLATLPTAGQPWTANVSWSDPQDIIISLSGGGILQRMDASRFPPVLSGLAALKKPTSPPTRLTPYCCLPLDEDHLWLVPDRDSESIALIASSARELKQVGYYRLGSCDHGRPGLGQIAKTGFGLPGKLCIANRKRKELMFASLRRTRSATTPRAAANLEKR